MRAAGRVGMYLHDEADIIQFLIRIPSQGQAAVVDRKTTMN